MSRPHPLARRALASAGARVSLGVAAAAAFALLLSKTSFADIDDYFPDDHAVVLTATTCTGDDPSTNVVCVQATRSAIVGGQFDLTASVTSDCCDLLNIRVLVGDDLDASGEIDPGEWTPVAVAPASSYLTGKRAVATASNVSASHGGYRIEHHWTWGTSFDETLAASVGHSIDSAYRVVAPVAGLSAANVEAGVKLTWSDPQAYDQVHVYRYLGASTTVDHAWVPEDAGATSFMDDDPPTGCVVRYQVVGLREGFTDSEGPSVTLERP